MEAIVELLHRIGKRHRPLELHPGGKEAACRDAVLALAGPWLLVGLAVLAPANPVQGQATQLSPLGSTLGLTNCDDCNESVSLTSVFGSGINFGGTVYTSMYVGTNGYVTFGHGNSGYHPTGIPGYTSGPIVAGQFDDLDPGDGGDVYYYQNAAEGYVVVTFLNVYPYRYPTSAGSGTNTFQIVLRKVASDPQDFQIELRYIDMNWAKSGNIGSWPTAGWSAGDGATYGEPDYSGTSSFLSIEGSTNVGISGVWRWNVQGGVVKSPPSVSATTAASSITGTSASTGGTVSSDGGSTVTARGVAYSTSSGPTIADNTVSGGSGTGTFSVSLTGLSTGTTYYIRAYATNAQGTSYGPERSFTTLSVVAPTVTTTAVTDVGAFSASAGGNVTADGGATVAARGVAYGTSPNPTTGDNTVASGTGTGSFSANLTNLSHSTTYYVRAYATNSAGTSYGSQETFTTPSPPTVTTAVVTEVGTTTASSGGEVTDDGGATVTARGVVYATSTDPDTDDSTVLSGTGEGTFSVALTGLAPGTTYYLRAFATNEAGTSYGEEKSFTMLKLNQTINFPGLDDQTYGDGSFSLPASASSGLAVVYATDDPEVATVSGSTLTITGVGTVTVTASQPGNGTYNPAAPVDQRFSVAQKRVKGWFRVPAWKVYDGTDLAEVLERRLLGVEAEDAGDVLLTGGTAHYDTPDVGEDKPVELLGAALSGPRAEHYTLGPINIERAAIVSGDADLVTIDGPSTVPAGTSGVDLQITVRDAFGNPRAVPVPTTFSLSTDLVHGTAEFGPSDVVTVKEGLSSTTFRYEGTFTLEGTHTLTATAIAGGALPAETAGTKDMTVVAGDVANFLVEGVGGGAVGTQTLGEPFEIRITALDGFGNVAEGFAGSATLSAGGALSSGSETGSFESGVLTSHEVVMASAGTFTLVASAVGGSATGASDPFLVIAPGAQVGVDLQLSDSRPALGDTITVRIVVINWGTTPATDVTVDNPLDGQDRLQALSVWREKGSLNTETGLWRIERLEPGEQAIMEIRAVVIVPSLPLSNNEVEER